MRLLKISLSCLLLTLTTQSFSQYNHGNLKIRYDDAYESDMEEPVANPEKFDLSFTHKNLRLFPIIANDAFRDEHRDVGKFTLLKDAIESEKIIITETGATNLANRNADTAPVNTVPNTSDGQVDINDQNDNLDQNIQIQQIQSYPDGEANISGGVSGTVNTLFAKNNSTDTIFIMAGDVVKGGKQDRVIAQDLVLAPGEDINLSAFCVEKSRWSVKEGNAGKFTGYYNISSMDIRKAATEDADQSKVWSTVDEHTSKNDAESDTKAYTNLENSEEYKKNVEEYMEKFKGAFDTDGRVVGVIAVTGDEFIGMDLFATHDLFVKSYDNLLHSYVGHAITKGEDVKIGNEEVFAYLDKILKDEEKQNEEIEKNGTVYEYNKKKLHITCYD